MLFLPVEHRSYKGPLDLYVCQSANSGHQGTLHHLPTLQNNNLFHRSMKQVENLSCFKLAQQKYT